MVFWALENCVLPTVAEQRMLSRVRKLSATMKPSESIDAQE